MIIIIDKKEYAVGLNWFAIGSSDELSQFQKEMELHHGVEKLSKDRSVQSTVALCPPEYNGQISLAGMLSYAYSNLLFVMATEYKDDNGQQLYYLCAVKNHAVTVDGDMVGTRETIISLYNQNYSDMSAELDPNSIDCFGSGVDETLFPGIHSIEASQLIDQAIRYSSQATIKPLGKKELSKSSVILVAGLFLVGSFAVYQFFLKPPPPPPPPPPTVAAPPPPPPDPYKVFMQSFTQTLSQEPRVTVLPSLMDALSSLPLSFEGWSIDNIEFDGNKPDTLTLRLKRANFANVEDLMKLNDKGYFTGIQLELTGNSAVVNYPFTPGQLEYIETSAFPKLSKKGSPLYYDLVANLQLNNIPYSGSTAEKNDFFAETNLSVSGQGLWSLGRLYDILSPYQTLGLKAVKISIKDGTYTWTIEGIIYG